MLFVVGVPLGNLKDITLRALEVLKFVDLILAEDTRITKKLLNYYQIKKPIISYHQHSKIKKVEYIIDLLKKGKKLALVCDAGTPGISDPGNKLIAEIIKKLGKNFPIIPVPGPSAFVTAVSVSGLPISRFLFLGFLPSKKKRKKFFEIILESRYPIVFYESAYRIIKTLKEIKDFFQKHKEENEELEIVVCKELTKKFEKILRGTLEEVIEEMKKEEIKGEFVIILSKTKLSGNRSLMLGRKW